VFDWLLEHADFATIDFRRTCTWTPRSLTVAALLWAWSVEETLTARFTAARKIAITTPGLGGLTAATYQAFLELLRAWTATLAVVLIAALRCRMQGDLADRFPVDGVAVFGVDGSRLELPRTASNEAGFAPKAARRASKTSPSKPRPGDRAEAARAQKADSPQRWLTVMFHVGTGLPWDWRTGPSDSSERDHLRPMIAALPPQAPVTADAGFVGYEYWKAWLDSGRHLLIRVGADVRRLRNLGYARGHDGPVDLWPDRAAARRQPPLVLRLVVARGGRPPVYLVTSVRDAEVLSNKQIIKIYALRWGVELFYRRFEPTLGRRELRSHCGANAEVEATWSLLGRWTLGLHGQVELSYDGVAASRVSVAGLLRADRAALKEYRGVPAPGGSLWEHRSVAVIDGYRRQNKASREYPRKKREPAIGAPEIRDATEVEINLARQIKDNQMPRLSA
jgi:hypothetical protein